MRSTSGAGSPSSHVASTRDKIEKKEEGLAFYLPAAEVSPADIKSPDSLELSTSPLISMQDIVSYDGALHFMQLTQEAFERLMGLNVSPIGLVFIVCVNRRPIYWGCFWSVYSTQSFSGVIIPVPLISPSATVALELGHPNRSFFCGEDPRNHPEIMRVLKNSGKLC